VAYKQVRLGDYFKFEKGLGYKGEFLAEESDVALIGMDSHDEGGGYKGGSEKPYSGAYKEINVAYPGDVIFAATDLTQDGRVLGSPLLVPESDEFQTYIYSHHLLKAFQKKEGFLPEFLYNLYRVEKFRRKAAYADSGTTVRALPAEVLEEQIVPLPDLPLQQAINDFIAMIDQQIANNKALSKSLETLAQAMFKSWFIDFDPVLAKSKGEKPFGMDESTASLFPSSFKESEIGSIPDGWHLDMLERFGPFKYGKALASKNRESGSVPVYGSNGVTGTHSKALVDGPQIIVGRKGTIGTVNLELENSWVIDTAFYCATENPEDIFFLYEVLRELKLETMNSDSAVPGLNREMAHKLQICLPSSEILQVFAEIAEPIFAKSRLALKNNKILVETRNSIMSEFIAQQRFLPKDMLAS
jgi:type I restriction enzyme S subunit